MDAEDQKAILAIALHAAIADGSKDETEREEIRRMAESLASETATVDLRALVQDVLLKRYTLEQAVGTLKSAGAWISLAHPWQYDFTRSKRRRLVADFIAAGGHALEVVNGLQPAEQVGGLAILAREFGMLASVGSDFHAPGDWSELGMYRPLPEDLSPLWERFDHARATTA